MARFYYQHIGVLTNNYWAEGPTVDIACAEMSDLLKSSNGILENCIVFEDDSEILKAFVERIKTTTGGLFRMQQWDKFGELAGSFVTRDPVAHVSETVCYVNPGYNGKLDKVLGIPVRVLAEDAGSIYFLYGRDDITKAHRLYVATALLLALDVVRQHPGAPGICITLPFGSHLSLPLAHKWSAISDTGTLYPGFHVVTPDTGDVTGLDEIQPGPEAEREDAEDGGSAA